MLEDYIRKLNIIYEVVNDLQIFLSEKIFIHSSCPEKQRAFNTLSDFSPTYSVLTVVKSLSVKRAFIELKCVTSFVL